MFHWYCVQSEIHLIVSLSTKVRLRDEAGSGMEVGNGEDASRNPKLCPNKASQHLHHLVKQCPSTQVLLCRVCWQRDRRGSTAFLSPDKGLLGQRHLGLLLRISIAPRDPAYSQPLFHWRRGLQPPDTSCRTPTQLPSLFTEPHPFAFNTQESNQVTIFKRL